MRQHSLPTLRATSSLQLDTLERTVDYPCTKSTSHPNAFGYEIVMANTSQCSMNTSCQARWLNLLKRLKHVDGSWFFYAFAHGGSVPLSQRRYVAWKRAIGEIWPKVPEVVEWFDQSRQWRRSLSPPCYLPPQQEPKEPLLQPQNPFDAYNKRFIASKRGGGGDFHCINLLQRRLIV